MPIAYERTSSVAEPDSIQWWIEFNLKKDGIESQVEKLQNLLAIIGEKFLIDNPSCVENVASAIECQGYRHKII
jgi:hypothetical protein